MRRAVDEVAWLELRLFGTNDLHNAESDDATGIGQKDCMNSQVNRTHGAPASIGLL